MIEGNVIVKFLRFNAETKPRKWLTIFIIPILFLSFFTPFLGVVNKAQAASLGVTPLFTCWEDVGGGNAKAYFGYNNINPNNVTILNGISNFFSPIPANRGQVETFVTGLESKAFYVIFPKGTQIVWSLEGQEIIASSDQDINQCSPMLFDSSLIAFINTPMYVQESSLEDLVAQIQTPDFVNRAEFYIDGGMINPVVITTKSPSTVFGMSIWNLNLPLSFGSHIITGKVLAGGYWYDINDVGKVYSLGNLVATYLQPSPTKTVFSSIDNPVQVQINDQFDQFDHIDFTIFKGNQNIGSHVVNRAMCDLRNAGIVVVCNIDMSTTWNQLSEGTYSVKSISVSKTSTQSIEITSDNFFVDSTKPLLNDFRVTNSLPYNLYSDLLNVEATASDLPDFGSVSQVNFFLNFQIEQGGIYVCSSTSPTLLDLKGVYNPLTSVYEASFSTSLLDGKYCVNSQSIDTSGNLSDLKSLKVIIDNSVLPSPSLLGWNVESISGNLTQSSPDLPCSVGGVFVGENINSLSQIWSEIEGINIKYIRRISVDGGENWNIPNNLVYTTAGMNVWSAFGDNEEASYLTEVMAFEDINNDNISNDGPLFQSNWSNSCKITFDKTKPLLEETKNIQSPSQNINLVFSFTFDDNSLRFNGNLEDTGEIIYGGSCIGDLLKSIPGENIINFKPLADGLYTNCFIKVRDNSGNISDSLNITSFIVDNSAPVISEKTPVLSISNDVKPTYVFSSSEPGKINYSGACSSDTTFAEVSDTSITLHQSTDQNFFLDGIYTNCSISITDPAGNLSNTIIISPFAIDTAPPVVKITSPSTRTLNNIVDIKGTITDLNNQNYYLVIKRKDSGVIAAGPGVVDISAVNSDTVSFSWRFNTKLVEDDIYTIYLESHDAAGNINQQSINSVDLTLDNSKPVVTPLKNTIVKEGDLFSFNIKAYDPHGATLRIQFKYTDPSGITSSDWIDWGTIAGNRVNNLGSYDFFHDLNFNGPFPTLIQFDSGPKGIWHKGIYEYRYYVTDNLGNSSDSGYDTYQFDEINAFYSKYEFQNVPPKATINQFTNGSIFEGKTKVEFIGSFIDPGFINNLHSPLDPSKDIDLTPAADDAPWMVTVDYGDGFIINSFDDDRLKVWKPGEISIPDHTYAKDGVYLVKLTVTESMAGVVTTPLRDTLYTTGSGESGFAVLKVTVGDLIPSTQVISGLNSGTLFALVNGGNGPYSFKWSGDCSGISQSSRYPVLPGIYNCTISVTDVDGDIGYASLEFSINAPDFPPVPVRGRPEVSPEAAYISTVGSVLGASVKIVKDENLFKIDADSGSFIQLKGGGTVCNQFDTLNFKTNSAISGKIFIYDHSKELYRNLPFADKKLTYDVCEIVLDGINPEALSEITIRTKYSLGWLKNNGLKESDLFLYTTKIMGDKLSSKEKLNIVESTNPNYRIVESSLSFLPLVFAISPAAKPSNFIVFQWGYFTLIAAVVIGLALTIKKILKNRSKS